MFFFTAQDYSNTVGEKNAFTLEKLYIKIIHKNIHKNFTYTTAPDSDVHVLLCRKNIPQDPQNSTVQMICIS